MGLGDSPEPLSRPSQGTRDGGVVKLFISDGEQSFQTGFLLLPRHLSDLDPREVGRLQPAVKIALCESEPPITVEFARLHKPVLHEVKDHHPAAGPKNLGCSQKSLRRVFRMVESLAKDHQIDRSGLDRRVLQVPLTKLQIGQTIQPGLLGTELDHFFGIIHSDHRAAAPCQQLGQKPLTGA